jgi:murein DD-endopeptidase MepM/ murein hydrolase activator NlpD
MKLTRAAASFGLMLLGLLLSLPAAAQVTDSGVTIHVVQRGETLYRIAMQYGVTVSDLARINGIVNAGNIQVGQRLLVPTGEEANPILPETHIVQPGETLRSIANFYSRTVTELAELNNISNPDTIYVGQKLLLSSDGEQQTATEQPTIEASALPPPESQPTTAPMASPTAVFEPDEAARVADSTLIHVVQRGETLFRIATAYGVTVNALAQANSIGDPTLIYAGQRLLIPGYEAPELAVDLPAPFTAIDVTPQTLVEGKTARIRISTSTSTLMSGTFLGHEVNVASEDNNTRHTILQGIPLFTEAGVYPLELVAVDTANDTVVGYTLNLQVAAGPYGREHIRLLAGRDGLLDPNVEQAELSIIENVTRPFTEPRSINGPMGLPSAATIISPFGTRRSYNGGPFDRFHSGTDFAGAPGTPVLATASGRVVLVDILNVRGMATIIDHGWGIYTGYWHQSQQYVQVGEFVTTGQVIGTIGSTGRVTGAHLHWEVWVGGVPVDPMQWVQFSFV